MIVCASISCSPQYRVHLVKITSEVNPHYTARIRTRVTFFYQGEKIGSAKLQNRALEAGKLLRYLAITEKPFDEVLAYYRLSQQLLGADVLEMSLSDDGESILHTGKVVGKKSDLKGKP